MTTSAAANAISNSIRSIFRCKYCNVYLCLDNNIVSSNGKLIPLNATGENRHKPHKCPVNPFRKIHYHLRQLPEDYPEEGKVERMYRVHGPITTFDTPKGTFSHLNKYQWRCTWCGTIDAYRIKAMKCCTNEEYD